MRTGIGTLPWADVPISHRAQDRGHGRVEIRTTKDVTIAAGILFPHASQAMQIIRKTRPLKGRKWTTETVYAVTDLDSEHAQPHQLAAWLRGHWAIENRLHWVSDVTWAEDRTSASNSWSDGLGTAFFALLAPTAVACPWCGDRPHPGAPPVDRCRLRRA
jgi:hypothetical protein